MKDPVLRRLARVAKELQAIRVMLETKRPLSLGRWASYKRVLVEIMFAIGRISRQLRDRSR